MSEYRNKIRDFNFVFKQPFVEELEESYGTALPF